MQNVLRYGLFVALFAIVLETRGDASIAGLERLPPV